jgi:uncharacterized protein YraI
MKTTRILATGLALTLALPVAAFAQNLTVSTATALNMRAGPGPYFPIVTTIPANTQVMLYGCVEDRSWCDVSWNNNRGWSYAAYLAYSAAPAQPPVYIQGATTLTVPALTYDQAYFDQYYATNQTIYVERDRLFAGGAAGAGAGAVIGALIAGPIGAAIGAGIGAGVGAGVDAVIEVPGEVRTYVTTQTPNPILLSGEVVIGAQVPVEVSLNTIPNYNYQYAYINGQWVLVDPNNRMIVAIVQ